MVLGVSIKADSVSRYPERNRSYRKLATTVPVKFLMTLDRHIIAFPHAHLPGDEQKNRFHSVQLWCSQRGDALSWCTTDTLEATKHDKKRGFDWNIVAGIIPAS